MVTVLIKQEQEHEHIHRHLRKALDQGMEGLALLDRNGRYIYTNPVHAQMYGYSVAEFIGQEWSFLYKPDLAEIIAEQYMPELNRVGSWRGELEGLRKDGSSFLAEVALTALEDDQGDYDGLICNCRDITEQKATADALSHFQRIDALGQLTGGVAHDFNNLLSVISGNLELAMTMAPPKEIQNYLSQAAEASDRGAELVSRLLIFARAKQLKPTSINVGELTEQLAQLLDRTVEENIEILWHIAPDVWHCFADARLLESAMINLIINARDALTNGGRIWVSVANNRDRHGVETVDFSVTDNGAGMSSEIQDRIFEPFFTTKPVGKGGGLGLSMVHGFVTQSGGAINVTSSADEGSKITISLPRADQAPSENKPRTGHLNHPKIAKGEVILVIEDEQNVRQTTVAMAQQLGFTALQAKSGFDAMQIISENTDISFVLSDVRLPGELQGDQISTKLAAMEQPIPCLLTTGYAPRDVHQVAHDKVLYKPFTIAELAKAIGQTIMG